MRRILPLFLFLLPLVVSANAVILSRHFTRDIFDNAKITQKHIRNGTVIVITAKDPLIVQKVKKIIIENIRLPHYSRIRPDQILELLRIKEISKSVIFLNNGIKLGLTSDIPEWIGRIHQLKMEGARKPI
jgi:hypothetical protein